MSAVVTPAPDAVPWFLRPDHRLDRRYLAAPPSERGVADDLARDGVAVVPGLVGEALTRELIAQLDPAFTADGGSRPGRLADAWRWSPAARALATHPAVTDLVAFVLGRRPVPFQTLDFKWGSEQPDHADSVHFDTVPHGWMIGAWVALEPVGPTNGTLRYQVGSHRWGAGSDGVGFESTFTRPDGPADYAAYERMVAGTVAAHPGHEVLLHAAAGDVVLWTADLLHGGAPVTDPAATRWSHVTHYLADGLAYVTPMHGRPAAGTHAVREHLPDIGTGRLVRSRLDGRPARIVRVGHGQSRLESRDAPPPIGVARVRSAALGVVGAARHRAGRVRAAGSPTGRLRPRRPRASR